MGFFLIDKQSSLAELAALEDADVIGLDLETTGKNGLVPQQGRIRLMQLASRTDTFVIDMDRVDPMPWVTPILSSPKTVKVLHHAKFDVKFLLHHHNLVIANLFCTMLASRLLAMGRSWRHSLAEVANRFLGETIDKSEQNSDWSGTLSEEQISYAATDAEILIRLYDVIVEALKKHKLVRVSQLEFRTVTPVAAMELRGLWIDREALSKVLVRIKKDNTNLEERILEHLQGADSLPGMNTLNLNAPEQVKTALHDRGIPVPDTSDASLRPLSIKYPFIADLLNYRHNSKIINSTLRPMLDMVLPETGRVHANYHQIASASGRFACSDPNVQQVPREKEVRACFKPEPGNRYVIADYSQVELRVAAGLSQDPIMLAAYKDGKDLHRLTAAITMGKDIEQVTNQERQAAKAINFGLIYAMGPRGLQQSAKSSYGVELTLEEATAFRQRYFQNYQGIARWQKEMEQLGKRRAYVRTSAGRIRTYQDGQMRITEVLNIPVQGTAAEGLKSALCIYWDLVRKEKLDAAVVAIIHDEIIVEVKQDQAERARQLLEEAMIKGIQWLVPNVVFEADAHIADSWADK